MEDLLHDDCVEACGATGTELAHERQSWRNIRVQQPVRLAGGVRLAHDLVAPR